MATPQTQAPPDVRTTPANQGFTSASLYVGDLHPDVAESQLFEKFNPVGAVASIRVCRDVATRRSLGYAYVNFHSPVDARRALETLNNTPIKNKPCRIMWSQRDPSVRKSGVGNVFIKNLAKNIDHQTLYDTFTAFGNILSCKVSLDDNGKSKGYGFVHFETQEAADAAIAKANGQELADQKVFVGPFIPRKERPPATAHKFTNVFLKDLEDSVSKDTLMEALGKYGKITSAYVNSPAAESHAHGKRFGFVNFEAPEAAAKCVEEQNGKSFTEGGKPVYVGRAQKKSEREQELRLKFERINLERAAKYQGVNLYVKNLDDTMDDEKLQAEFAQFGDITSCKVMRDDKNNSRGFGFVCFKTPDEATRAITEMNSKMIHGKPLYVALAQRKEIRRAQLEATYAARSGKGIQGHVGPQMFPPGAPVPFFPHQPQQFVGFQQPMVRGSRGGWPNYSHPNPMYGGMGNIRQAGQGQAQTTRHGGRGRSNPGIRAGGNNFGRGGGPRPEGGPPPQNFSHEESLAARIQQAPASEHFNLVGESLFPLVEKTHPEQAGKITGMLLDRYNQNQFQDLVAIMDSPEQLNAKVAEAMAVLQEANLGEPKQ